MSDAVQRWWMSHLNDGTPMGRLYLKALRIKHRKSSGLWVPTMWHLALRGYTDAMIDLADWFAEGDSLQAFGSPQDRFSAAGLYLRAYRHGDARAARNAAISSFNRNDLGGYRTWLRRAAKAGDEVSGRELKYFETRLWHSAARKVRRHRPEQRRDDW